MRILISTSINCLIRYWKFILVANSLKMNYFPLRSSHFNLFLILITVVNCTVYFKGKDSGLDSNSIVSCLHMVTLKTFSNENKRFQDRNKTVVESIEEGEGEVDQGALNAVKIRVHDPLNCGRRGDHCLEDGDCCSDNCITYFCW